MKRRAEKTTEALSEGESEKQRKEKLKEVFDGEFLSAIAARDYERVKSLMDEYPGVANHRDKSNNTPLHYAATVLDSRIIELLLDNGAKTNVLNDNDFTPLHNAALCNVSSRKEGEIFMESVQSSIGKLLAAGANPNAQDEEGNTPLHILSSNGYSTPSELVDVAATLINGGAKIETKNKQQVTPAGLALEERENEIYEAIRMRKMGRIQDDLPVEDEKTVRAEIEQKIGESPLLQFLTKPDEMVLRFNKLSQYIKKENIEKVSELIEQDPTLVTYQDRDGNTALHIAMATNKDEIVADKLFKAMSEEDRRNIRNKHGVSAQDMVNAIAYIAKKPTLQKKMEILDRDPQLVFVKKRDGKTLIDEELKLNKGLKPEDIAQGYFLMRLIDNNEQEAAVSLIKTNPHLANFRDSNGDSLLHHALHSTSVKLSSVTTALTEARANPDAPNKTGLSARDTITGYELMTLSGWNHDDTGAIHVERIEKILKKTPKLKDFRDFEESTLLHAAAYGQNPKAIDLLLDKGLDVNARDNHGRTPLHNLATSISGEGYVFDVDNSALLLKKLIKKNADIEAKENDGNNFLHVMAISGVGLEDIQALVKKLNISEGILDIKNNEEKTFKDIAEGLKRKPEQREISSDNRTSSIIESPEPSVSSDRGNSANTLLAIDSRSLSGVSLSGRSLTSILRSIGRRLSSAGSYVMSLFSSDRQSSSSSKYQDARLGSGSASEVNVADFQSIDGGPSIRDPSAEPRESSEVSKGSLSYSPRSTVIDLEALDRELKDEIAFAAAKLDALYKKDSRRSFVHKSSVRSTSSVDSLKKNDKRRSF